MSKETKLEKFATVLSAEHRLISKQRETRNQDPDNEQHTGISISGGGIRSASLALGVLQAMYFEKVLPKVDYLSTVSGGGYIGSSWTWFNNLKQQGKLGDVDEKYFFPFGRHSEGSRSSDSSVESKILSFLRMHASYLVPGDGLNYFSGFAVVLRNMLLPLLVYISLLIVLFTGVIWFEKSALHLHVIETSIATLDLALTIPAGVTEKRYNLFGMLALTTIALTIISGFLYGLVSYFFTRTTITGYKVRTMVQQIMGYGVIATLGFGFVGLLPFLIHTVEDTIPTTLSGMLGILGGVFHFVQLNRRRSTGLSSNAIAIISSLLMIVAIFCLAYGIASNNPEIWMYALPAALIPGVLC